MDFDNNEIASSDIFRKEVERSIFNEENNEIKEIDGIEIVRSMKYLGVEINDGDNIFELQKKKII